ncbi:MAG: four helix bundle protein [Balneolaceae bacterium]|nr:four helix bundle protein [Balneolaceae bacterium]
MSIPNMKFEDLKAWKEARIMTNQIYEICNKKPLSLEFSLSDQLKRASTSVMANLAEGFEREHKAEKIQFWNIARASAGEVRSILYVISDNNLADSKKIEVLFKQSTKVSRLCRGLIKSYKSKH